MKSSDLEASVRPVGGGPDGDRGDRLQYMADMLSELQVMAVKEGCTTLAGLLGLSQSEASLQARSKIRS